MRIGLYLSNNSPEEGGSFTFHECILNAVRSIESHHEVICFYYGAERTGLDDHLHWVRLEKTAGGKDRPLNRAVLNHKIDLVWFVTVPIFETVDIPYIYTVWDLMHRAQPYFPEVSVSGWLWEQRENFYQYVLPRAAYVVTGNQAGVDAVVDYYRIPAERVKALPLPTPDFALHPGTGRAPQGAPIRQPFLLYPAQYWPHKNHIALLLALKILVEQEQLDFSVVFTGSDKGNLTYIQEAVTKLGLSDRVHFKGFVARDELVYLYQNAFALAYPSFFGPDNIPPLEAFALGCPVVAAQVAGADEQMGDAALLFDPTDEVQFAARIKALHLDTALRESLIQRGRERAGKWTAREYVGKIFAIADEFQPIRRCWSVKAPYVHL